MYADILDERLIIVLHKLARNLDEKQQLIRIIPIISERRKRKLNISIRRGLKLEALKIEYFFIKVKEE